MFKNIVFYVSIFAFALGCQIGKREFTIITAKKIHAKQELPIMFEDETGARSLYGYKNQANEIVIPAKYYYASDYNKYGVAFIYNDRFHSFDMIDIKGRSIAAMQAYENGPDEFQEGLARYIEDGKTGFINEAGVRVIPANYAYAMPFENGRARVTQKYKSVKSGEHTIICSDSWGEIDKNGKLVLDYSIKTNC